MYFTIFPTVTSQQLLRRQKRDMRWTQEYDQQEVLINEETPSIFLLVVLPNPLKNLVWEQDFIYRGFSTKVNLLIPQICLPSIKRISPFFPLSHSVTNNRPTILQALRTYVYLPVKDVASTVAMASELEVDTGGGSTEVADT